MIELIATIILVIGLLGMAIILFRKITALLELPEVSKISQEPLISKIKREVKKLPGAGKFDHELYLQKILSKVRILTLKTESKTGGWLEKLRQKSNQKNDHNNDKYWEELKKAKNGK